MNTKQNFQRKTKKDEPIEKLEVHQRTTRSKAKQEELSITKNRKPSNKKATSPKITENKKDLPLLDKNKNSFNIKNKQPTNNNIFNLPTNLLVNSNKRKREEIKKNPKTIIKNLSQKTDSDSLDEIATKKVKLEINKEKSVKIKKNNSKKKSSKKISNPIKDKINLKVKYKESSSDIESQDNAASSDSESSGSLGKNVEKTQVINKSKGKVNKNKSNLKIKKYVNNIKKNNKIEIEEESKSDEKSESSEEEHQSKILLKTNSQDFKNIISSASNNKKNPKPIYKHIFLDSSSEYEEDFKNIPKKINLKKRNIKPNQNISVNQLSLNDDENKSIHPEEEKEDLQSETNSYSSRGKKSRKSKTISPNKKTQKNKKKTEKKEKAPKTKKQKIYTKFTKGKFNPLIEISENSLYLDSLENKLYDDCCISCNQKNIIRAALTNNKPLFHDCLNSRDKISYILDNWSFDSHLNIINLAIQNNDKKMITEIIKDLYEVKKPRVSEPRSQLFSIDTATGAVSYKAYSTFTRKLNMTRGNKMGINSFQEKSRISEKEVFEKAILKYCKDPKIIQFIEALLTTMNSNIRSQTNNFWNYSNIFTLNLEVNNLIANFARKANKHILSFLIKRNLKLSYFGFNSLHYEVLEYTHGNFTCHKASVNKKANESKITPVHLACLNPCADVIKNLVFLGGDLNFPDNKGNKAIHYAAICESPEPLKYLLSINCNFEDLNLKKNSPIMLAVKKGRLENVKILCEQNIIKLNSKNKKGMNLLTIAAKNNHFQILEFLVTEKALKVDFPGTDRKTSLMFASALGHLQTVKKLLELGARVTKKDKFKRSPLIFSVKSGQTVVTSILLKHGSLYDDPDSSNNYPLHYACAYGWKEIIDLLLKAGADINKICDWNITPLELCILQQHTGLVFYLLENSVININSILYGGNTLLHRYMENLNPKIYNDLIYLIEKKKANVNIVNNKGYSAIHYIAEYSFSTFCNSLLEEKLFPDNQVRNDIIRLLSESSVVWLRYTNFINKLMNLLNDNNCSYNFPQLEESGDNIPKNPLVLAFNSDNFPFIERFFEKNLDLFFEDVNKNNIFNYLCELIFKKNSKNLIEFILFKLNNLNCEKLINQVNSQGLTPILNLFSNYYNNIMPKFSQIQNKENLIFRIKKLRNLGLQSINDIINYMNPPVNNICNNSNKDLNPSFSGLLNNQINNNIPRKAASFIPTPNNFSQYPNKSCFPRHKKSKSKRIKNQISDEEELDVNEVKLEVLSDKDELNIEQINEEIKKNLEDEKNEDEKIKNDSSLFNKKIDWTLFDFSEERFYEDLKIHKNSQNNNQMEIEEDIIDSNSSQDSKYSNCKTDFNDYYDIFLALAISINKISLDHTELDLVLNKSRFNLNEFIELNFKKLFLEFIHFNSDLYVIEKKIEIKNTKLNPNYPEVPVAYNSINYLHPRPSKKKSKKIYNQTEEDEQNSYFSKKKWNLLMFLSIYPHEEIFKILIEDYKLDINYIDLLECNFLFYLTENYNNIINISSINYFTKFLNILLKNGLNINQKNKKKENIFNIMGLDLMRNLSFMKILAENKIDINNVSNLNINTLIYYVKNLDKENILKLTQNFNFDINHPDNNLRTPLHHLTMRIHSIRDTDVSLIHTLLKFKPNCNFQDILGRTPLHYLFIDETYEYENIYRDPIVYLSTLLEFKGIETNIPDFIGNLPIHYAAQKGSTICAMSLYNKDFINYKNEEGNTPLAYSLIFNQISIATYLFQQNSNINECVYPLKDRNLVNYKKMLKLKEENLLKNKENTENSEEDKESEESGEENLNYNFGLGKINSAPRKKRASLGRDPYQQKNENNQYKNNCIINEIFRKGNEYEESFSIFRFAVKKDFQGLVYLFINSGYDLMIAIQECFIEKMFNLALLLLDKSPYIENYTKLNEKKQNLFHILAINGKNNTNANYNLVDLFEKLNSKDIDFYEQDYQGYTPLHYACETDFFELVKLIQNKIDLHKNNSIFSMTGNNLFYFYNLSHIGYSPFICFLRNLNFASFDDYFKLFDKLDLVNDMRTLFKENSYGKDYKCNFLIYLIRNMEKLDEYNINLLKFNVNINSCSSGFNFNNNSNTNFNLGLNNNPNNISSFFSGGSLNNIKVNQPSFPINFNNQNNLNNPFMQAPLIKNNIYQGEVVNNKNINKFENNDKISIYTNSFVDLLIQKFISFGSILMDKDSDGLDILSYSVKQNNFELIKLIVNKYQILKDATDNLGKSLIHYVISPQKGGSYENHKLLKFLINNGFKYDIIDSFGKSPFDYSLEKNSEVFLNVFKDLKLTDNSVKLIRKNSLPFGEDINLNSVDFEKDAKSLIFEQEEKNNNTKNIKENFILPDKVGKFDINTHFVVKDLIGESEDYYSVTLTKVNIMNGIYGQYVFYKMQVIHEKNRNIYILWNRWGMIGETGAYQRTPYHSLDDAKIEFKKIFKSKTDFEKIYGKYMLLKFKKSRVMHNQLLKPFDFKKLPSTKIKQKIIFNLIKEFSNSALYFKALNEINYDNNNFSIEFLDENILNKANDLLDEISKNANELKSFSSVLNYDDVVIEKVHNINFKIYELSNKYYELIPKERFKDNPIKPILSAQDLANERNTMNILTYIENTVKIILGAIYQSRNLNPIDYILSAMNVKIDLLKKSDHEYDLIYNYINNSEIKPIIKNVFKLKRVEEAENFKSKWGENSNRLLLFHGSKVFNFVGILTNGLKIAPVEAPSTGLSYGKGVYFADQFSKSYNYCDYYEYEDENHLKIKNKYMLLCEVALGNQLLYDSLVGIEDNFSNLKNGYDSLYVKGLKNPDENKIFVMDNGVKIPTGKFVENTNLNGKYYLGDHSEYIIFDSSQME